MYVIFPLDDLLDLNSAKGSKRETRSSSHLTQARQPVQVLPPSQPNQQLPSQLQPPLNQLAAPTPQQQQQQQQQPTTPPKQQSKEQQQQQKPTTTLTTTPTTTPTTTITTTLKKTPSKSSIKSQSSPLSPQFSSSVPSSSSNSSHNNSLKKQQQQQQSSKPHRPHFHPDLVVSQQQQQQQRQQSHSTSTTETSSTSSTGAKAKVLLRPPPAEGKPAANRSSWAGSPSSSFLATESSVPRSISFKGPEDLASARDQCEGDTKKSTNLKSSEHKESENPQEVRVNNRNLTQISRGHSFRSHLGRSESYRSYLNGNSCVRPQQQQQQQHGSENIKAQSRPGIEAGKATSDPVSESVKRQEVVLVAAAEKRKSHNLPSPESTASHQPSHSPLAQDSRRPPTHRHSSTRSSHSSGSQRASDLTFQGGVSVPPPPSPPLGREVASASIRSQGGAVRPRGLPRSAMASEATLRDLTHPSANETLKAHTSVNFKLVKTVSDFTSQLSRIHEQHAEQIQRLVETFRKKNSELRNERPPCSSQIFQAWETLLQEVEVDSQIHSDVASTLSRQVARPLIEKTFYRKIQSRKIFTHRESFDTILAKTEDMLKKCRRDYSEAHQNHCRTQSNASLAAYFDAHNAYVQQLHATNGMLLEYHDTTLPTLLQELETVYLDVSGVVADCILQGADIVAAKAVEQGSRYDSLAGFCRGCDGRSDLVSLVRTLDPALSQPTRAPQHRYAQPHLPQSPDAANGEPLLQDPPPPPLKNELVMDRLAALSSRNRYDALKKEAADLERQIAQLQDAQDTLLRIQQRSLESSVFNKANELQEDISMKRFDLRVAQVHLAAVRAQKDLFVPKDGGGGEGKERKMSNSSTGTMKTKWIKAFKSLKASDTPSSKKNQRDKEKDAAATFESAHVFQEYTYKKITACDICHQILRGHSRQGLKCRLCKMNVHSDCMGQVARCQPKSRLLRRQRSTSEIETKHIEAGEEENKTGKAEEVDLIYQVLKQAGDLGGRRSTHGSMERDLGRDLGGSAASSGSGSATSLHRRHPRPTNTGATLTVNPAPVASCSDPRRDFPSPTYSIQALPLFFNGPSRSYYPSEAPSSPVHNRRLLTARNMRMSSVELPDENEKSLSSASTSPCPSPVSKKPHRLLPTSLYVVLYNFTSRHPDELDLRAGYKVTVTDTSDPDWWQGKYFHRTGYFPSKYVTRINGGEKPLQVTHNLQVNDGENGLKLLRDQIVIQVGEESDGMVMIRNGDNQQGVCPVKYLQEA